MSKRGLSMEEKKTKMLEIFHESADFYSLKELEKIAPKSKGIVVQSVKEVLDDLCSDGFVIMDKIGTGNYFWALPSAAGAVKTATLGKVTKELAKTNDTILETRSRIIEAEKGREDTPARQALLSTLSALSSHSVELKLELSAFGAADPVKYEKKKQAVEICKEGAARWTDNTLILMQYTGSLGTDSGDVRQMLGISEDWEDLKM